MDPMLPKHIMASIAEYFRPIVFGLGVRFVVDGIDSVTDEDYQRDSIFLRMNGPTLHEGSSGVEWYTLEIQLVITDIIQTTIENSYNIYEWSGILQRALQAPLPIFQFDPSGDPEQDILIGCLEPDKNTRNNIRVANYQVIDKDLPVRQMSVNGKFILCQ